MSLHEITNSNQQFLNKKNVIGVGAGKKFVKGTPTGEDALIFFVENKVAMGDLLIRDLIPPTVDGYKTDVFNVGKAVAQGLTQKNRPLTPGFGCSHGWVTAGTIGGIFLRNNVPVILSNNHVIAATNKAVPGHAIVNPACFDGGNVQNPYHRIAKLTQFVKLEAVNNTQDSAIAEIFSEVEKTNYTDEIYNIGRPTGYNVATVDMAVQKSGRTTGYTTGRVVATGASVSVYYDGNQAKKFKDCIITTAMSQGGDSGSLLLDMDKRIVGLLFAGSDKISIHNPIKYPVETYGLELCKKTLTVIENKIKIYKDGIKIPEEFASVDAAKQFATTQMYANEEILKLVVQSDIEIIRDISDQIVIEYE